MARVSSPTRAIPKDWSRLNLPGEVFVVAYIEGLPHFIIRWEAANLAKVFPQLDEQVPPRMLYRDIRSGQDYARTQMLADKSEDSLSGNTMMLVWLGWLRARRRDYEKAIKTLSQEGVYYLHLVYAREHWLFLGSSKEQSQSTVRQLFQTSYPIIH